MVKDEAVDPLAIAKKERSLAARWLTRAANTAEELGKQDLKSVSHTKYERITSSYYEKLAKWEEFQHRVELETEESALEEEIEAAADYKDAVDEKICALEEAWSLAHPPVSVEPVITQSSHSTASTSEPTVNLPKLDLPKFYGDVLQFTSFWQQFEEIVDKRRDLAAVSKFNYLVSSLKSDAKNVIEGLPVTNEHYEDAKKLVVNRYGRKELVIFHHIQALLTLPVTSKTEELIKFHDKLMAHVRSLSALGITSDQFGVILTPIVVSRLSQGIREEWSRESEGHEGDLNHLMDFLEKEMRRRDRCKTLGGLDESAEKRPEGWKGGHRNKPPTGTATVLHSDSNARKCAFCKKNHASEKCYKFLKLDVSARFDAVKENNLCFKCMSNNHFSRSCNKKCETCGGRHHATLCEGAEGGNSANLVGTEIQAEQKEGGSSVVPGVTMTVSHQNNISLLPTAHVRVKGRDGWIAATLLFDSGANRSYVSRSLVSQVGPKFIRNSDISFSTFGGRSHGSKTKVYGLSLQTVSGQEVSVELSEVPMICLPLARPMVDQKFLAEFDHLDLAYDFAGQSVDGDMIIDILVGQDLFWTLMLGKIFRGEKSGVVAQESVFGWVLSGASGPIEYSGISLLNMSTIPDDVVKTFWDLESIGVKDGGVEVDPIFQDFRDKIKFNEDSGRYQTGLTWKREHPVLLDNKKAAMSSYLRLEKRLQKTPDLRHGYDEALKEMECNKFIVEVPEEDVDGSGNQVFYLPHFPHVRESSVSTRIRPVFNASCKGQNGVSLNDCLESGPNLNPGVVDIVTRFRRWKYAVTSDVRKAFLQIELAAEDQDVHRFFWRSEDGRIRIMKFVRVTFGIKCSPFLLSGTILHHLLLCPPSFVVNELSENLYVDDFLSGADSEAGVQQLYEEANKVMKSAGMELAKWTSNESSLLGGGSSSLTSQYVKVLGVSWDPNKDHFSFVASTLPDQVKCTKRVVLSLIARVFDPLGFVLPFTMTARFIFQDVWRLGIGWDEKLPNCLESSFQNWLKGLSALEKVVIPRRYFDVPWTECMSGIELHAFGDASLKGYGAVVYLRFQLSSGEICCTLVRSCARVAPLERKTLPRLELLGSLVTAQLLASVIRSLNLSGDVNYTCWTDSMVALGWIQGLPSKWKPWVANRVSSIQALTNSQRWKHVAGQDNPADLLTRGLSADKLVDSDLWWHGPSFLRKPGVVDLPSQEVVMPASDEVEAERKVAAVEAILLSLDVPCMFEMERWSTWNKAIRVVAWTLRFVNRARKLSAVDSVHLEAEELVVAKQYYVKILQLQYFGKEIALLKAGKLIPRDSKLLKLAPFLDDKELLRVRGRLQLSDLAYESKHPLILPKSYGARLVVRFVHFLQNHAGVDAMIATVRMDYEVFGLRGMAKSIKKGCASCQRCDVRACNEPPAPLPRDRVTMAPAFSVTGIDFAGPVYCLDFPDKKFYICLMVCGVVRAVHLELTDSLSSEDFVLAFRRFSALHRVPSVVYSDNGTNLIGGKKILTSYLGPLAPEWKLICPRSPWWGGWWERLVRSVKNAIRKTVGRRCLTRVELETCLYEVASSINSRPLTFVGTDVENKVPLTPNHFLSGQGNQSLDSRIVEDPENVGVHTLSLRHQELIQRLEDFWRIWSTEYIRSLPPSFQKFKKEGNLNIGSVVLIKEDGMPRMKWCYGIVEKLHVGRDGIPRAAVIRTAHGRKTRAIQRLYNLEIDEKPDDVVGENDGATREVAPGTSAEPESEVAVADDEVDEVGVNESNDGEDLGTVDDVRVDRFSNRPVRSRGLPGKYRDYIMY